jgi:hypothetical protein
MKYQKPSLINIADGKTKGKPIVRAYCAYGGGGSAGGGSCYNGSVN